MDLTQPETHVHNAEAAQIAQTGVDAAEAIPTPRKPRAAHSAINENRLPPARIGKDSVRRPLNCSLHGKRYPLEGSTMCGHPKCLAQWVKMCCYRSGLIRRRVAYMHRLSIFDDFIQFLYMYYVQLYRSAEEKYKIMLTPQFIAYATTNFLNLPKYSPIRKREISVPGIFTRYDMQEHLSGTSTIGMALQAHLNAVDETFMHNPHNSVLAQEVQRFMQTNGETLSMLVMREDITREDAFKILLQQERDLQEKENERARVQKLKPKIVRTNPALQDVRIAMVTAQTQVIAWAHTLGDEVYDANDREFERSLTTLEGLEGLHGR